MFLGLQPFAPNSLAEALPYHPFSEASQFVTPVSLFAAPNLNTQIPFPSPGASIYPAAYGTTAPYSTGHSVIPPLQKPEENLPFSNTCTAAFTSSQHNMALTAAMVVPETPKEENFPEEINIPNIENQAPIVNNSSPATDSSIKSASSTPAGKKSPAKPTRTSARFISQQKSPSKSPGKSPRNLIENNKAQSKTKEKRNKVPNRFQQNRGRGRGRQRNTRNAEMDPYITNTIHNKLQGTVYDLDFEDDELASDNITDWRAMRERRRSTDIHDRKSESSYLSRDSSQSPKFTSPSSQKFKGYSTDLRDLRPPTPINEVQINKNIPSPVAIGPTERFADIGQPVLPGPVDMRTYNSNFEPNQGTDAASYSNQILGEFARVGPQLCDIDEEYEKNLEMSLRSEKKEIETSESNLKVSLSDSRNQLKVKIKGPFLDSNYTSTVSQLSTTVDSYEISSNITSLSTANTNTIASSITPASGTSNLRRMRKKELLRQYWTQDMNMDEPANAQIAGQATIPTTTPVSRTTITIPKAVASMTSIPTREDYKAVVDANMEKKRRKEKGMRGVDMDLEMPERRRSVGSNGSNASGGDNSNYKKKGRPPRNAQQPTTPKLKIKIGGTILGDTYSTMDDKKFKGRPPKKRITTIAKPSIEDLKRESMKYRRMVMADFDFEKKKKSKVDKERKKKRKKEKLQIISENSDSTKLIIRIGKKKEEASGNVNATSVEISESETSTFALNASETTIKTTTTTTTTSVVDTTNNKTSDLRKVRSIKLKFARCQEGSYVMKTESEQSSGEPPPSQTPLEPIIKDKVEEPVALPEPDPHESPPENPPEPQPPPPLIPPLPIINKDCEVR